MRHWFLSYNSQDLALMEALEAALRRNDPDSTIFFAPRNLRAGGYWLPTLADEIARASAFVLFVGPNGTGPWQVLEYYEALDKRVKSPDFSVVLVLLDGSPAPGLPFLRHLHWIITKDPASGETLAKLTDAATGGGGPAARLWKHTEPYRGLAAMTEADTDFFFGRARETVEVLEALAATPEKVTMLVGNSGVGKSSLAMAGVLGALKRQAWPDDAAAPGRWPIRFTDSRRWCFLRVTPGTDPVRALVEAFLQTWRLDPTDPDDAAKAKGWVDRLTSGELALADLLKATEGQYEKLGQAKPPAFFLYVDQGEELYVRAEYRQRVDFSALIAEGVADLRLSVMMSLRADEFGALQGDAALYAVHRQVNVPPLRKEQLDEVVSRPAEILGARFEAEHLAGDIAQRTADESAKDLGALPLLSYLLDDMWRQMTARDDGVLRLPPAAVELAGVLVERAEAFLALHPAAEDRVRRLLTLKLTNVREDGEPTRRRALRSEFTDGEDWRLISELADHPNRLLVTARPENGEAYAEVAHEALFRRWKKFEGWIDQERDFLIWKSGLEESRRTYDAAPAEHKADALLRGLPLAQARSWHARRADDLEEADRQFIHLSLKRESSEREQKTKARRRTLQLAAAVGVLLLGVGVGLAWANRDYLKAQATVLAEMVWPRTLSAEAEAALKPRDDFKECADCPEMVVVPAREQGFTMGSPETEDGRDSDEVQHSVTIPRPFGVSRFEVTADEWDACVLLGGCDWPAPETGWGRGTRPVMNINWDDARRYVAWLSKRTGKDYRLLSEAEWEYAARAGTAKAYFWGDEIGEGHANCNGCGSQWDVKQTAPVDSFEPNGFGLYQMHGNVWEWVEDCWHDSYAGAPDDGTVWMEEAGGDCGRRVVRGGSWFGYPWLLRSALRNRFTTDGRNNDLGLRVGRTLDR